MYNLFWCCFTKSLHSFTKDAYYVESKLIGDCHNCLTFLLDPNFQLKMQFNYFININFTHTYIFAIFFLSLPPPFYLLLEVYCFLSFNIHLQHIFVCFVTSFEKKVLPSFPSRLLNNKCNHFSHWFSH